MILNELPGLELHMMAQHVHRLLSQPQRKRVHRPAASTARLLGEYRHSPGRTSRIRINHTFRPACSAAGVHDERPGLIWTGTAQLLLQAGVIRVAWLPGLQELQLCPNSGGNRVEDVPEAGSSQSYASLRICQGIVKLPAAA